MWTSGLRALGLNSRQPITGLVLALREGQMDKFLFVCPSLPSYLGEAVRWAEGASGSQVEESLIPVVL